MYDRTLRHGVVAKFTRFEPIEDARSDGQHKLIKCECGARYYKSNRKAHQEYCAARFKRMPAPRATAKPGRKRKSYAPAADSTSAVDPASWTPYQRRLFEALDSILDELTDIAFHPKRLA